MEIFVKASTKKLVGISALGALTLVELIQLQQANAAPVIFTGSVQPDGGYGGNLQVAITVDAVGGIYKITNITTPVQPSGVNSTFAARAIPTLTTEALAAQSASINGVSGASSISTAWIQSLASAIAAAAAAGERIGSPVSGITSTPPSTPPTTPPAPSRTPKPKPTISKADPLAAILGKLVAAGTINQAQADAVLAAIRAGQAPHSFATKNGSEGDEGGSNLTTMPAPNVSQPNKGINTSKLKGSRHHAPSH
jgi:uncharacterized protein with FMN-binding domain